MELKNYWRFKISRVRAFTLLESLVALIVISGSLLLFQSMSQLLVSEVRYQLYLGNGKIKRIQEAKN